MLTFHFGFEGIEEGLDEEAFAQHDLVGHGRQVVLHGAADAGDQVQAMPPERVEQRVADVTFVGVDFTCQALGSVVQNRAVGGAARG